MNDPVRVRVRLTPRGGRDGLDGWGLDESGRPYLKARVAASPTDGQANAALLRLLSKALGAPPSRLSVAQGAAARIKTIHIHGLEADEVMARLGGPPPAA